MRLLIRAPNWLGDIVMALPAIAAVRARYPEAHLAVAAPAPFAPLCAQAPGVDAAVGLPGSGVRALGAHAAALRAGRFDLAILLTNSFGSALAASRAGIPERWGYRRDFRGPLLTRAVPRRRAPAAARHHSFYYLRLLAALGIEAAGGEARLTVPADGAAAADALLRDGGWRPEQPIVGIAPGAAYGQAKRWPPERAAACVRMLARHGVRAVLVGSAADRPSARAIQSALAGAPEAAPIDLVGRTDLAALMGVLARCRAVVANDSGAMHVASAVGSPVVAVFGPTDEQATAPLGRHTIVRHDVWCRPCLLRECPIDHRCMRGIPADRVVAAVAGWLAAGSGDADA